MRAGLSIDSTVDVNRLRDQYTQYALRDVEEHLQLEFGGLINSSEHFQQRRIRVNFIQTFVRVSNENARLPPRDSGGRPARGINPQFSVGVEMLGDYLSRDVRPPIAQAFVVDWLENESAEIEGCEIEMLILPLTQPVTYGGILHLTFQGFGYEDDTSSEEEKDDVN